MTLPYRLIWILLLTFGSTLHAEHVMVEVQRGDGIYSLLRRYHLIEYACNIDEFKRLNRLSTNSKLLVGRLYRLPVEIYSYDGTSIRSTTGNDSWERAVAIKEYNELLLQENLRERDYRKDRVLYLPYHIDHCAGPASGSNQPEIVNLGENAGSEEELDRVKDRRQDRDPIAVPEQVTTAGPRTFSIFGPAHAEVPLIDRALAGKIYYIVAGHGGPDPGAIGRRNGHLLAEDEYAYDVALRLCRNILEHGGTPYMIVRDENDGIRDDTYLTPDRDETVWGGASLPRNQKLRLFQRSDIINALYEENLAKGIIDQTMIAIHIDSRHRGQQIDVFLYYPEGDLIGANRADKIHRTLRAKYDQYRPGRGYEGSVSERDLHMLRETKPSGVYIELANIANASDQQRIVRYQNRQLLADWLLLGLMD
ncbi:N-acetylmuramoyl-L-alanine amidase [Lewinella aquimaris]|uniref:N-acetylmuramoyl-L-alanine amidase n=1 Tax=Neolewinella aquimaris TaxID=1835722 RepID=A0A840DZ16_9BACT|nr:N-acetylmuramoyl-L-alanine amidase [Neolewinella aquimaris]MBB4078231.1 N-acetylmuramoyl-L-alanine amidase [Neolewinella aquimaris]